MSQENLETLRHTVEAFNRGDWDEARLDFDSSARWPPAEAGSEASSYFGYDAIRNYLMSWVENFDDFRLDVTEMTDAGEQVFVELQVSGLGRQSGERSSSPHHALVVSFEDSRILGVTMFMSKDDALRAAGL
jgi:ketosteroid isomerase-like protein